MILTNKGDYNKKYINATNNNSQKNYTQGAVLKHVIQWIPLTTYNLLRNTGRAGRRAEETQTSSDKETMEKKCDAVKKRRHRRRFVLVYQ